MLDFWPGCAYTLLQRNAHGWLLPTPAYLRAWLQRPELAPVAESCAAECALHAALYEDPLRALPGTVLAALQDEDARQNYAHFIALRDGLLESGSLQAWLLAQWRGGSVRVPPLFIELIVQAVMRGVLDGETDAFMARAAELFYRPQRLATHEGRLLAGDRDTLALQQETQGLGELGRLLAQAQMPLKALSLHVLRADNQAQYWAEAARAPARHGFLLDLTHELTHDLGHGLAFALTHAHSGLKALARLLERWVAHLLGVQVTITVQQRIEDAHWRWHIGLDAEASALLDDLYRGHEVSAERQSRLVSLFRLDFTDNADMRADLAGTPVYLGLMMDADKNLRLKPQNLLLNLPLARAS